jgi:hypothetical protein
LTTQQLKNLQVPYTWTGNQIIGFILHENTTSR